MGVIFKWSWQKLTLDWSYVKVKGKVFYGKIPQRRIYYHRLWGQISTTFSNATEVAKLATLSCSWPQPLTDNDVRDGRYNLRTVTLHLQRQHPLQAARLVHSINRFSLCRETTLQPSAREATTLPMRTISGNAMQPDFWQITSYI